THTVESMIEIYPTPSVDFYTDPEEASILTPNIQFHAINEGALALYWYFGDGDSATINTASPVHFYPAVGQYGVQLVGVNHYNCKDTAYKEITIVDELSFYSPTGFTPNGDGINDCFKLCGNGIDPNEFYFVVYDRWGEKVFETEIYDGEDDCQGCGEGSWNGAMNNDPNLADELLPSGVYIWYCSFVDNFGNQHEETGEIHLVR
ncbi:MAG: gliding motility-associated C-terminal domain-containing protein, partial [Spirochaetales bacterium]|nr:gliding motility-associated C-terminal domain-containing protein [Spirochaetales bacterium]